MMGMRGEIDDLENRLCEPESSSACGRLTTGILRMSGAQSPMNLSAEKFNQEAELYYRTDLRKRHITEALSLLGEDLKKLENAPEGLRSDVRRLLDGVLREASIGEFLSHAGDEILEETASEKTLEKLIHMILVHIYYKTELHQKQE